MSWRGFAKRRIEAFLVQSGIAQRAAHRVGHQSGVLAFHNVSADNDAPCGDRSLHMCESHFGELIDALSRRAAIVPLADILQPPRGTRGLQLALTFDDAYQGAVTLGVAVLDHLQLPSTIFVAPGLLGAPETWWDSLANHSSGSIPPLQRDELLDGEDAGRGDHIRKRMARSGLLPSSATTVPSSMGIASAETLRAMAKQYKVSLGSHSWSHPNLAALANNPFARDELRAELERSMDWLKEFGRSFIPMLAYPYGRWNETAVRAVADAGYAAAFRVDGGAFGRVAPPVHAIPRINVPEAMSAAGALLRIAGWR